MKKTWGLSAALLLAATLFAPSAEAAVDTSKKETEVEKPNLNEIRLLGTNNEDWGFIEEKEPNNTFTQANKISTDDLVTGTFTNKDKDLYKLTIDGDEEVNIGLSIHTEEETKMDLSITVYDEKQKKVDVFDELTDEFGYFGDYYLKPGTYYLEASDLKNVNSGEMYYLYSYVYEEEPYIERIDGKDRYETSAFIAARSSGGYPVEHVFLATGQDFPDALAGSPLASMYAAPILLTKQNSLPDITKSTLQLLNAKSVTILGGTGAVSTQVEKSLKQLGIEVDRIAGKDRYATAAAIADELPPTDEVIVAYGRNFPDALAMGPVASMYMMPILLTEKDTLPKATVEALKSYDTSFVVGGTGAVGSKVFKQLPDPDRISGKNRFDTSVAIADYFDLDPFQVTIATGDHFADALSGSVLSYGTPLLLTPKTKLDPTVKAYVEQNETLMFTILGGPGAVSEKVEDDIWDLFE
ncbi:cell wall-binding repeat-containing protein [Halobacillus kuroshimensis]|uniref:Cell wall-binding repeat-containing protein n=1 Tax=Halobacillus kuroshimensis TaxID=302481 RepID=A0ABS3DRJ1_9BACI|nr:cell wall-binding repeat-containing protein [Halobacillus kuroshimensis]